MFHGHDQYFYLQIVMTDTDYGTPKTIQPPRENKYIYCFLSGFYKKVLKCYESLLISC